MRYHFLKPTRGSGEAQSPVICATVSLHSEVKIGLKTTFKRTRESVHCCLYSICHHFLPERDYVTFGSLLSQFRLSVCLQRWCTLLRGLNLSAKFLHRCVRWPSSDLRAKFYGDSRRGTPPSGAINARGISK